MILNHVDNGFGCGCGWQQQNPHKGWRHQKYENRFSYYEYRGELRSGAAA